MASYLVKCECKACTELVPNDQQICEFCFEICLHFPHGSNANARNLATTVNVSLHHTQDILEELGLDPVDWINRMKLHGRICLTRYLEEIEYNNAMFAAACSEER